MDMEVGEYQEIVNPEQRAIIKQRITDLVHEVKDKEYDTIIFLDKSARPLYTAFYHSFKSNSPDTNIPRIRFLNIGLEKQRVLYHWAKDHLPLPDDGIYKISGFVTPDNLISIFGKENVADVIKSLKGSIKVLIVDDLAHSGKTQKIAKAVLGSVDSELQINQFELLETEE